MSEHKYITDKQIKSMRNVASTIGIDEAGLNSVLSYLNVLRAELTAREEPLSQDDPWHRWLAHTFPEIYAYISSLRAQLKAAQEQFTTSQQVRSALLSELEKQSAFSARLIEQRCDQDEEIARQREDNHKIALAVYPHKNPHYPFSTSTEFIVEEIHRLHQNQAELDRMRTALEEIEFATRDNDLFALIHEVAVRALNPPWKQAEPLDLPALIELDRDYVQKRQDEGKAE